MFALWAALLTLSSCTRARDPSNLLLGRAPIAITRAHHAERLTDGVRAVKGDRWNTDLTTRIDQGGGIEWDLGQERAIAAIWLQADHDDRYAVLGSRDHERWDTLWEASEQREGGLQARQIRGLAAKARYVRLEPRGGDGAYSSSELAVFDAANAAMPPAGAERHGARATKAEERELRWSMAVAIALTALGIALLGQAGASARRTRLELLAISAALGVIMIATALIYRDAYRGNTIDDAYISFQYAKNWASGHGLVFNPGEHVEGYTNFLWIAVLAPLWPLSAHDPVRFAAAAFALALALAVVAVLVLGDAARRALERPVFWLLPPLALAFDDAFLCYTVFSLENQLLVACLVAAIWTTIARPRHFEWLLGVCFLLVALTRPDGLLFAATYFAAGAIELFFLAASERQRRVHELARTLLAFIVPYAIYFAVRFTYYGYPLPNTFYLKVGGTFAAVPRGLEYVASYARERYGMPLLALFAIFAWKRSWVRWLATYAVLHTAYVVYVGGDFYSGQRFLMGLTPIFALLAATGLEDCARRWPNANVRRAATAIALASPLLVRWGTLKGGPLPLEIRTWGDVVDNHVRFAKWLHGVARPDAMIALGDIGGAGFFGDLRVMDMYGVIDPTIAHRDVPRFGEGKPGHEKKATPEDVLARQPSYIKLGFVRFPRVPPGYYVFNDFPPSLDIDGLLVRDDLAAGRELEGTAFHMNASELERWTREGDAFASAPMSKPVKKQPRVPFSHGSLIDSFTAESGDDATGRLRSPEFELRGDRLRLLVGGGRDPLHLRVSLSIDGQVIYSATGTNHDLLGRREWDISTLRGRHARIEIIDDARGAWGHILVDEIVQWSGQPNTSGKL